MEREFDTVFSLLTEGSDYRRLRLPIRIVMVREHGGESKMPYGVKKQAFLGIVIPAV